MTTPKLSSANIRDDGGTGFNGHLKHGIGDVLQCSVVEAGKEHAALQQIFELVFYGVWLVYDDLGGSAASNPNLGTDL